MKHIYINPRLRIIDLQSEQMIAGSMKVSNSSVDTQLSNKKEMDMWGNENVWK